jgi:hypothetical protein
MKRLLEFGLVILAKVKKKKTKRILEEQKLRIG